RPRAGALHLVGDRLARAVARRAGAGVKLPRARRLAAARHDRAGAVVPFLVPVAGADRVAFLGPDRLAGVRLADLLPRLRHRAVAGDGHLPAVLLVHRVVGAVVLRHLVLLPHRLADRVAALLDVLLVNRLASGVLADDVVIFPDRLAGGVAAFLDVLLVHRLAGGVAALLH